MKTTPPAKTQRAYQQKSRAAAAEATGRRIIDCFLKRLETQWFEEVTLEALAMDSAVTVQTILRKFGSKAGLLEAAHHHMGETVTIRRSVDPGDIDRTVNALTDDYESAGDLVIRLLAQEERHPVLKPMLDRGRSGHREWLALVFASHLDPLTPARRTTLLDSLVIAADLYVWKLVRREMGRPVAAYKALVRNLLHAVLRDGGPVPDTLPVKLSNKKQK